MLLIKNFKHVVIFLLMTAFVISCNPLPEVVVATSAVKAITTKSAQISGSITSSEHTVITELGLCWNFAANPEVGDNHVSTTDVNEAFSYTLTDLQPETEYHVRAYAFDGSQYFYGNDVCFTTLPIGLFTVSRYNQDRTRILISKGNLQYQASTNTWRFAEHQWDYVGCSEPDQHGNLIKGTVDGSSNHLIGPDYDGWIDLFGWGTSGYDHGAVCYQPWSTSTNDFDYYSYGTPTCDLYEFSDWGSNPISNGGNEPNLWRTLSKNEWYYLLKMRITACGFCSVKAKVHDVIGTILVPDDWDNTIVHLNNYAPYCGINNVSQEDWDLLEKNGAVFLPMTGCRDGSEVSLADYCGCYWTSSYVYFYGSPVQKATAWQIVLESEGLFHEEDDHRHLGTAVRLVRDYDMN